MRLSRWAAGRSAFDTGTAHPHLFAVRVKPLTLVGVGVIVHRPKPQDVHPAMLAAGFGILSRQGLANTRLRAVTSGMAHEPAVSGGRGGSGQRGGIAAKRSDSFGLGIGVDKVRRTRCRRGQRRIAFGRLQGSGRQNRELVRAFARVLDIGQRHILAPAATGGKAKTEDQYCHARHAHRPSPSVSRTDVSHPLPKVTRRFSQAG